MNDAPEPRRSIAPAVISLIVAGVLILVVGLWVGKRQAARAASGETAAAETPGALTILSPADGDELATDTTRLLFATPAPLELTPRGWLAGSWHPHVLVDGQERMAGATDIADLGDGRFAWRVSLPPGPHTLRLVWATLAHRIVESDASGTVSVRVGGSGTPADGPGR